MLSFACSQKDESVPFRVFPCRWIFQCNLAFSIFIMKFTSQAATLVTLATTASCAAIVQKRDSCTADVEATQVRLAYHGDRGMSVSWNTNSKLDTPSVAFGKTMDLGGIATSDQSVTYPTSSTYNNHVTITGLKPNTRYHYQPYCSDRIYSFTTARTAGDGHDFKFAMVGDMGTMGPDGLSTTVGKGAANPLAPGDKTSIDSLHELKESFDFVFHGQSTLFDLKFSQLTFRSWRYCVR